MVLVGLAVVGTTLFEAAPRETEIRYDLGPDHGRVVEVRLSYRHDGEEVKGARFTWPDGAPPSLRHEVELVPGRYEVRAELVAPGEQRTIERALRVPSEGVVRIDLFDEAVALVAEARR